MSSRSRFPFSGSALVFGLIVSSVTSAALAEDGDTPSRALFKEGRALASEGKYEQACPKFEAALALEVGVGTQFNLADCWEHIGRTASAQKLFLGAAASAKAAGQTDREQVLRDRAAALEPRISKLVIDVSDTSPRLSIKRDELPLDQEQWGKALPIDAGKYELTAKAPGKKQWHASVVVKPGAPVVTVEVPVLEPLEEVKPKPVAAVAKPAVTAKSGELTSSPAEPPRDRSSSSGPNYRALGLGGIGVAALAVGTVMGIRYKSNNDDAKAICPANVNCTPKEIEDHDQLVDHARSQRAWMYAGIGVGVASLAGAAALYLFDKPHTATARVRALPAFGQNVVGASVIGQF